MQHRVHPRRLTAALVARVVAGAVAGVAAGVVAGVVAGSAPGRPALAADGVVRLSVAGRVNQEPGIAASGSTVAVAWAAGRGAAVDLFVAVSRDGGRTFGPPVRANDRPGTVRGGADPTWLVGLVRGGRLACGPTA